MNSKLFSTYDDDFGFRPGGTPDISRWWNHRKLGQCVSLAPEGRQTRLVRRPSGAGQIVLSAFPVVPPPANVRCASDTKTVKHFLTHNNFVRVGRIFCALVFILSLLALPGVAQKAPSHRANYLFAYFKNNGEDGLH